MDICVASASVNEDGISPGEVPANVHRLPNVLGLTAARELRDDIKARLASGVVVLDAEAVDRVSTPCVQVLLAAGLAAASANASFRIVNGSQAFSAAVVDLGLESQFRNWMV